MRADSIIIRSEGSSRFITSSFEYSEAVVMSDTPENQIQVGTIRVVVADVKVRPRNCRFAQKRRNFFSQPWSSTNLYKFDLK
jgi:hypothetical protein